MGAKRTITPETEAAVVAAYGSGRRSGEIAKEFGINRKTVTTIVRRNGAEVLSRQIASGRRPMDTTPLHPRIAELRERGWSQQKIANEVGVSQAVVSRALKKMGRSTVLGLNGSRHPAWKGGRTVQQGGYVRVYLDQDDPMYPFMADRIGYVLEHRLVMARAIGRPLAKHETVHHVDGDPSNNHISNLQLRQGRHGKGVAMACLDCGSHNVGPVPLREASMYRCGECSAPVVDGVRTCGHDGVIIAEARSVLAGRGGVR